MTNKEYYKDKIFEIACQGDSIAFDTVKHKMVACADVRCTSCKFDFSGCKGQISKWLEEEYEEPQVDWSKVAVDTKILVRNHQDTEWQKRHFAKCEDGIVYAFFGGCTSWSDEDVGDVVGWKYAKLYEEGE